MMRFYLVYDVKHHFPEELPGVLDPNSIDKIIQVPSQFWVTFYSWIQGSNALRHYLRRLQPQPESISWDFRLKVGIRKEEDFTHRADLYLIPYPRHPQPDAVPIFEKLVKLFADDVKVNVSIKRFGVLGLRNDASLDIVVIGMTPNRDGICRQSNITIPGVGMKYYSNTEPHAAEITISVDVPETVRGPAKILDKPSPHDAIINAANGAVVECDYSTLAAYNHNLVIGATTSSTIPGASITTVDMKDISEMGVRALLDYLHCGEDMKAVGDDLKIVFELFRAGHKYKIGVLEKMAIDVILDTESDKFPVDLAIEVFCYAKNVDVISARNLRNKVARVLKSKLNEFEASSAYADLISQQPHDANVLCMYIGTVE